MPVWEVDLTAIGLGVSGTFHSEVLETRKVYNLTCWALLGRERDEHVRSDSNKL